MTPFQNQSFKVIFFLGALFTSACNTTPAQDDSAQISSVAGAIAGGVIGSQVANEGKRTVGAAIGAAAGAIAGHGIGQHGKQNSFRAVPFQSSKQLDAVFLREKTKLNKVYGQNISMLPSANPFPVELYKQKESASDGPDWDYKAILRIGDYYYPLRLGNGHTVTLVDAKGNLGPERMIVLYTGCFSDAGCMGSTHAIRVFSDQPFTLTKFDGELLKRKDAMSVSDYDRLKGQGALLMHFYRYTETEGCFLEDSAFLSSGRGFERIWTKRENVECAG